LAAVRAYCAPRAVHVARLKGRSPLEGGGRKTVNGIEGRGVEGKWKEMEKKGRDGVRRVKREEMEARITNK